MKKFYFYAIFIASISTSYAQNHFITTWNTEAGTGQTGNKTIKLPISGGAYDVDINNDGDFNDANEANRTGTQTITFASAGTKTIRVRANPTHNASKQLQIRFNSSNQPQKLTSINKWGDIVWTSMQAAFYGCANLTITAAGAGAPNLTMVTEMNNMFRNCGKINSDLNSWDVSKVTNMGGAFGNAFDFNGDIGSWNVSNVENMGSMFNGASAFNRDISNWDVSNVENMTFMFWSSQYARRSNIDLSRWDVSKVVNMNSMFKGARNFNSDLSNWNVSSVKNMNAMFDDNYEFTSDLNTWDVSAATDMGNMFKNARNFTSYLATWNVSKVVNMNNMFLNAHSFNSDISDWKVSSATSMANMFKNASRFSSDLSNWNVSGVTNMANMFEGANAFTSSDYDALLLGWSALTLQPDITFTAPPTTYCSGETGRNTLENAPNNWTIAGDSGLSCPLPFVTTWDAGNGSTISLPITQGRYDADTNNDGTFDMINRTGSLNVNLSAGTHTIKVRPNTAYNTEKNLIIRFSKRGATPEKLASVNNWGDIVWTTMVDAFRDCSNLTIADDAGVPDLTQVTNISHMFRFATNFTGDLSAWNVSNVTNMRFIFHGASSFNSDLSAWNVSKIISIGDVFNGASSFTSDLSSWDVSNVTGMENTFNGATNFNSDLSSWNVSKATHMDNMLTEADSFSRENYNALLVGWSSLPTLVSGITFGAPPTGYCSDGEAGKNTLTSAPNSWTITGDNGLDCPFVTTWNTEAGGQTGNTTIKLPLSGGAYDVDTNNDGTFDLIDHQSQTVELGSKGTHTIAIRPSASNSANRLRINFGSSESQPEKLTSIDRWGLTIVWTSMETAFHGCSNLTIADDAGVPNLTEVTNTHGMFANATNFTGDLSDWDVSNVTDMSVMLAETNSFNSDLSSWDVSKAKNTRAMFRNQASTSSFNSDLSSWNVSSVANMTDMFKGATSFSTENYEALLTGWSALPTLQSGVTFGAPPANYCKQAEREILTGTYGWSISGDGNLIGCPVDPLILTFDTTREQAATGQAVYIPITGGSYDIDTNNDGIYDDLNNTSAVLEHRFASPGIHTIRIRPNPTHNPDNQLSINFDENSGEASSYAPTLTRVDKWGDIVWTSMERAFTSCTNLTIAEDAGVPNLTMVTSMKSMFAGTSINSDISTWDVSNVTDMSRMFLYSTNFNSDLGSWNVSNVVDMGYMFYQASSFNTDISTWNVSNVTSMTSMFNADDPNAMSFSDYNYEKLLAGWSSLPTLQSGVSFTAPPASYCSSTGRDKLTDLVTEGGYGWTITGDAGSTGCSNLALSIDAFLQGPYDTTTNKMGDGLRAAGIIPDTSPYGDETFAVNRPFDVATGDDVIVDWVQVSLHHPNDASIVINSTSALLQRDGDVVVSDGINALQIQGIAGDYKVSINHRNHIPVITDAAQSLSATNTAIDFTNDLTIVTGGSNAMAEVATGIYALFSGDVNQNGQVQVDDYNAAIQDVGKGGYLTSDVDMNGELQVSDINFVLKTLGKGAQF